MEISATLSANFITAHPYISAGVLLYVVLIGFFVYAVKTAPLVDADENIIEHKGDELDITIEDLMNMR